MFERILRSFTSFLLHLFALVVMGGVSTAVGLLVERPAVAYFAWGIGGLGCLAILYSLWISFIEDY